MAKNSIFTIIVATQAASMWPVKMAPLASAPPTISASASTEELGSGGQRRPLIVGPMPNDPLSIQPPRSGERVAAPLPAPLLS